MPQKSFFAALFDFSFTDFVTTKWIQVIYVVNICFIAWIPLAGFLAMILMHNFIGLLAFAFSGLMFVLALIGIRMYLEAFVVAFRIEEHTRRLANDGTMAIPQISGRR